MKSAKAALKIVGKSNLTSRRVVTLARVAVLFMILGILGASPAGQARQIQPSALPSEVRELLLGGGLAGAAGGAVVVLSEAPIAFPQALIPEDATVLAAALGSAMTSVVVDVKSQFSLASTRFQWRLADDGWINLSPMMTGFASADVWFQRPMTLCRSTHFAELVAQPRASGGAMIGIALWQDTQRTCARTATREPFEDVPLPLFTPPPAATFSGIRGGGGPFDLYTQARIETTLSIEAVTRHLVEQLRAAGWTVNGETVRDGATSTTRLAARSRFNAPLSGVLTLSRPPGGSAMDAVFRIAVTRNL